MKIELSNYDAEKLLELMERGLAYTDLFYTSCKAMKTIQRKVQTQIQKVSKQHV